MDRTRIAIRASALRVSSFSSIGDALEQRRPAEYTGAAKARRWTDCHAFSHLAFPRQSVGLLTAMRL